jgi:hypothetical protein
MPRTSLLFATALLLSGCHLPEREAALTPLPEGQPFTYAELVTRARNQATTALEAFYVDGWTDLETIATGLDQTARLLPKSNDIPASVKDRLGKDTDQLRQDAKELGKAARAKDSKAVNEILQRINVRIRDLRVEEKTPEPAKKI